MINVSANQSAFYEVKLIISIIYEEEACLLYGNTFNNFNSYVGRSLTSVLTRLSPVQIPLPLIRLPLVQYWPSLYLVCMWNSI